VGGSVWVSSRSASRTLSLTQLSFHTTAVSQDLYTVSLSSSSSLCALVVLTRTRSVALVRRFFNSPARARTLQLPPVQPFFLKNLACVFSSCYLFRSAHMRASLSPCSFKEAYIHVRRQSYDRTIQAQERPRQAYTQVECICPWGRNAVARGCYLFRSAHMRASLSPCSFKEAYIHVRRLGSRNLQCI
jgi:hypothetical protein